MSRITTYQAKYLANYLTRRLPANDINKLTASLQDAQVDLTPHQVEAALFAFKSPLSKGAILADVVDLGKTIEAIYMIETKAAVDITNDEIQQKKVAAEEYCRYASEYTAENGGKPWKYILLPHDTVDRTASFEFLIAIH